MTQTWAEQMNLSNLSTWNGELKTKVYDKLNELEGASKVLQGELEELKKVKNLGTDTKRTEDGKKNDDEKKECSKSYKLDR